jgi:hypothetical protein
MQNRKQEESRTYTNGVGFHVETNDVSLISALQQENAANHA